MENAPGHGSSVLRRFTVTTMCVATGICPPLQVNGRDAGGLRLDLRPDHIPRGSTPPRLEAAEEADKPTPAAKRPRLSGEEEEGAQAAIPLSDNNDRGEE